MVAIDGKVRFRGKVNRVLLERLLFAEARNALAPLVALAAMILAPNALGDEPVEGSKVVMVIHGGAGPLSKELMTPELETLYRGDLEASLKAGQAVLHGGGKSVEAVVAAIKVLEDSPRFNAGKGAVFTHDGKNELDASIMDGHSGKAGAVAGVTTVKNPITAALAVMEKSKHVMMVSQGRRPLRPGAGPGGRRPFLLPHRAALGGIAEGPQEGARRGPTRKADECASPPRHGRRRGRSTIAATWRRGPRPAG